MKLFPHNKHGWGLSRMCVTAWLSRLPLRLKRRPHSVHWYGCSPVWIRMCTVSAPLCLKFMPHSLQLYGFSPVWILTWSFRLFDSLKRFEQKEQAYFFSSFFFFRCLVLTGVTALTKPSIFFLFWLRADWETPDHLQLSTSFSAVLNALLLRLWLELRVKEWGSQSASSSELDDVDSSTLITWGGWGSLRSWQWLQSGWVPTFLWHVSSSGSTKKAWQ